MLTSDEEFVIPETTDPRHLPVFDENGQTIGYVDVEPFLREQGELKDLEQLRHDLMNVKNIVMRLQAQIRQLELRRGRA